MNERFSRHRVSRNCLSRQKGNPVSRRNLLRGIGVSLTLPLFQRDAEAMKLPDGEHAPMRMVCVANPLGFVPDSFFPAASGPLEKLPPLLQPLAKLRKHLSVFSHLDHGVGGGHQAVHAFLSGIRDNQSAQWDNRNLTVDQRAAELTRGQTRFPSLVASVGHVSGELECRTSWSSTGVNIPPITELGKLFDALFISEDIAGRVAKRKSYRQHASILDAVFQQAKTVDRGLGKVDREKLDEYLTSIRSVEARLQISEEWLDRPKPQVSMNPPVAHQAFTHRLPLFYDLIRLALETDSTRVAALSIPGNLPVGDLGLEGNYHAFSHHGKSERLLKPLLEIETFQMKQLAAFIASLKDSKQPGGKSLLETTMVLAGSGMGNASSHSNKNLPILLSGGGFRHGHHHVMPEESHRRVPLCNLFTTMLQRFGDTETERFNRATGTLDVLG